MNKIILSGRLVQDPKVGMTKKETKFVTFDLAVDRRKSDEADKVDFFRVMAFGKRAETIEKYFKKGKPIIVTGELWTDEYINKQGETVKTGSVMVDSFEFVPVDKLPKAIPDEMAQDESPVKEDSSEVVEAESQLEPQQSDENQEMVDPRDEAFLRD